MSLFPPLAIQLQETQVWAILSRAVMSCSIRHTEGSPMKGNLALTSPEYQTRHVNAALQMLWPPEF